MSGARSSTAGPGPTSSDEGTSRSGASSLPWWSFRPGRCGFMCVEYPRTPAQSGLRQAVARTGRGRPAAARDRLPHPKSGLRHGSDADDAADDAADHEPPRGTGTLTPRRDVARILRQDLARCGTGRRHGSAADDVLWRDAGPTTRPTTGPRRGPWHTAALPGRAAATRRRRSQRGFLPADNTQPGAHRRPLKSAAPEPFRAPLSPIRWEAGAVRVFPHTNRLPSNLTSSLDVSGPDL